MKRLFIFFATLAILLAACAALPADFPASSPSPSAKATATPSATASPALHLTPDTLTPDTPTITPLPTIPTFTPTFDVRTIITATPAPKAECPKIQNGLTLALPEPDQAGAPTSALIPPILSYLIAGGNTSDLKFSLTNLYGVYSPKITSVDLTNDLIPEFVIESSYEIYILTCDQNSYVISQIFNGATVSKYITGIVLFFYDLNLDGIQEIITTSTFGNGGRTIGIYEWDGMKYVSSGEFFWLARVPFDANIIDTDKNGLNELVVLSRERYNGPFDSLPTLRDRTFSIEWNGKAHIIKQERYLDTKFRFQVVQDADREVANGIFSQTLLFYERAISDTSLQEWSSNKRLQFKDIVNAQYTALPTPTPFPSDLTEYPRLAAYAYYRMIILHTFLGETEAAQVKYATLQEKFPAESPGYPYVEMATDFWNAYQSSGLMYEACAAAIAYADAHPEILIPLGSDYHGAQSHTYIPADVCPFR